MNRELPEWKARVFFKRSLKKMTIDLKSMTAMSSKEKDELVAKLDSAEEFLNYCFDENEFLSVEEKGFRKDFYEIRAKFLKKTKKWR